MHAEFAAQGDVLSWKERDESVPYLIWQVWWGPMRPARHWLPVLDS